MQPGKRYDVWSPEEDAALLKARAEGATYEELAQIFRRSIGAIKSRLRHLGMVEARKDLSK